MPRLRRLVLFPHTNVLRLRSQPWIGALLGEYIVLTIGLGHDTLSVGTIGLGHYTLDICNDRFRSCYVGIG